MLLEMAQILLLMACCLSIVTPVAIFHCCRKILVHLSKCASQRRTKDKYNSDHQDHQRGKHCCNAVGDCVITCSRKSLTWIHTVRPRGTNEPWGFPPFASSREAVTYNDFILLGVAAFMSRECLFLNQ